MHDTLYEHQRSLDDEHLAGYAEEFGVTSDELEAAYAGGPEADKVRTDFRSGVRSGVQLVTPTFFVNGGNADHGDCTGRGRCSVGIFSRGRQRVDTRCSLR